MNKKRALDNLPKYHWGNGATAWPYLQHDDLSVIRERIPPGVAEIPHWHQRSRQFFLVLAGELTMRLQNDRIILTAGEGIEVEPGQLHQTLNEGTSDVHCLVISSPNSHIDRHNVDNESGSSA